MGAPIQPTEADIRAACEEAGVSYLYTSRWLDRDHPAGSVLNTICLLVLTLARRIAAEREAVPEARATAAEAENAKLRKALEGFAEAAARDGDPAFAHLILDARAALEESRNVG
jgi:hypothetical protein